MKIPWDEKYRPKNLDDVVGPKEMIEKFKQYLESPQENLPHLLFCGTPGLGKTTCAKILADSITENVMYVNASEERGIDKSRQIIEFASQCAWDESGMKIIILDEFDNMTQDAQLSLKNPMEHYKDQARFILTCNRETKIEDAILSRCVSHNFSGNKSEIKKQIAHRCLNILGTENVRAVDFNRDIKILISEYYPDIRSIVGALQEFTSSGIFKVDQSRIQQHRDELIKLVQDGNWKQIQSTLCNKVPYESMFSTLFSSAEELSKTAHIDLMLCIADGVKSDSRVVDRQINFMATVLEIMRIINVI